MQKDVNKMARIEAKRHTSVSQRTYCLRYFKKQTLNFCLFMTVLLLLLFAFLFVCL
jgi:hypothetical protein